MLLNHQIGDGQFGFSSMHSADGEHTEIVEQAHEVVGVGDAGGGEATLQFTGDIALTHQRLNDGSIVGKLLVLANEHAQFLVVDANVIFHHILWCLATHYIIFNEVEHHI